MMRSKRNSVAAFLLTLMMCVQLVIPAFNQPVFAAQSDDSDYFTMTANSFTIGGVTITKAELISALSEAKRMPDGWHQRAPRFAASLEYTESPAFDPEAQSALASIGLGVSSVFQKIVYQLTLVDIAGTTWYFVAGGVAFIVTVTSSGFIINNVSQGYNWLTYELSQYFANHMEDSWFDFDEAESGEENNQERTDEEILDTWGDPDTLDDHFDAHGPDFGATDPVDYADKANQHYENQEEFQVKIDEEGITRVYDADTNTFGAYNPDGTTRTFFKPDGGQSYFDSQPGSPY